MRLLCPNCRKPLVPITGTGCGSTEILTCSLGHRFSNNEGVIVLLEAQFGRHLEGFLATYTQVRMAENKRVLDTSAYEALPYGPLTVGNPEWRLRQYDLTLLKKLLAEKSRARQVPGLQILEIGAWNGWLTHHLVNMGHQVMAIDYFTDTYDGLGARKFYARSKIQAASSGNAPAQNSMAMSAEYTQQADNWLAIQMDVADLSIIDQEFDIVIINHCLQFFTNAVAFVQVAKQRVAPGGCLLLLGMEFYWDYGPKVRQVASFREYLSKFGLDFLHPTKAYLNFEDMAGLCAESVKLRALPRLWLANVKSLMKPTLPRHYYGIYEKDETSGC